MVYNTNIISSRTPTSLHLHSIMKRECFIYLSNSISCPLPTMFKYQLVLENKYKSFVPTFDTTTSNWYFPYTHSGPPYPWWATILLQFGQLAMTRPETNLTNCIFCSYFPQIFIPIRRSVAWYPPLPVKQLQ